MQLLGDAFLLSSRGIFFVQKERGVFVKRVACRTQFLLSSRGIFFVQKERGVV